jgi:hypothetical protein
MSEQRHSVSTISEHLSGKPVATSVIGECPRDQRSWECQCGRCGSSVLSEACEGCGGDGFLLDPDFDEDDDEIDMCPDCLGRGVFNSCCSSREYCEANPMPGREKIGRGEIEWFTMDLEETR